MISCTWFLESGPESGSGCVLNGARLAFALLPGRSAVFAGARSAGVGVVVVVAVLVSAQGFHDGAKRPKRSFAGLRLGLNFGVRRWSVSPRRLVERDSQFEVLRGLSARGRRLEGTFGTGGELLAVGQLLGFGFWVAVVGRRRRVGNVHGFGSSVRWGELVLVFVGLCDGQLRGPLGSGRFGLVLEVPPLAPPPHRLRLPGRVFSQQLALDSISVHVSLLQRPLTVTRSRFGRQHHLRPRLDERAETRDQHKSLSNTSSSRIISTFFNQDAVTVQVTLFKILSLVKNNQNFANAVLV